jgi:putative flippase GtrA
MDQKLSARNALSTFIVRRRRTLATQFMSFAGVGALATLLQYLVLVLLVYADILNAVAASAVGYIAGALLSYWLNYHYTFRSTSDHARSMAKFAIVACAGLVLNTAIMAGLTSGLHWHYLLSQVLATGIVLIWNFAANRAWTFSW